jgi:hypothetical protein
VGGAGAPVDSRWRRRLFWIALITAVLMLALPMAPFLVIPVAWPFLAEQTGTHQFHDVGVATLLWLMLLGLLVQFRGARRQVGAMQQTLLVIGMFIGATAVTRPATLLQPLMFSFALPFVVAVLHPARLDVARIRWRLDPWLGAGAAMSAVPFLAYGWQQLRLDSSHLPLVAHGGHWTTMATVAAAIPALALLGAGRPSGWRVPAWSAGGAAILLGVASLSLQHRPSSVGPAWSALTIVWGLSFIILGIARSRMRPAT